MFLESTWKVSTSLLTFALCVNSETTHLHERGNVIRMTPRSKVKRSTYRCNNGPCNWATEELLCKLKNASLFFLFIFFILGPSENRWDKRVLCFPQTASFSPSLMCLFCVWNDSKCVVVDFLCTCRQQLQWEMWCVQLGNYSLGSHYTQKTLWWNRRTSFPHHVGCAQRWVAKCLNGGGDHSNSHPGDK